MTTSTTPQATEPAPTPRNWFVRHKIMTALLALLIIVGIVQATGGEDTDGDQAPNTTSGAEQQQSGTETQSPREQLTAAITDALGEGNRDVPRVATVTYRNEHVAVEWAINDNITEGFIKTSARHDAFDILAAINETGLPVTQASLDGTFSMQDEYGNASESLVLSLVYPDRVLQRINYDNVGVTDTIHELATGLSFVHPAFQGE
ncbi:MAG: hypothetical protein GEU83_12130 [Pseudonocardiaceae bacterium]|nr:hypothetical protein [Pseudonocardiaceae bacterium]